MIINYVLPLLDSGISLSEINRLTVIEVFDYIQAIAESNSYKNYDSWFDLDQMDERQTDHGTFKPRSKQKDLRWSTWEIKSAMDYDRYYVPKLGNGAWANMMTKQMPNTFGFD